MYPERAQVFEGVPIEVNLKLRGSVDDALDASTKIVDCIRRGRGILRIYDWKEKILPTRHFALPIRDAGITGRVARCAKLAAKEEYLAGLLSSAVPLVE
ncbi:MAG: hypothetical protein WA624_01575 [Methylocella sp.]